MSQSPKVLQQIEALPARTDFLARLAVGATLAALAVVAFAGVITDESAVRVKLIIMGFELIMLAWVAGFIASSFYRTGIWRFRMRQEHLAQRSVNA